MRLDAEETNKKQLRLCGIRGKSVTSSSQQDGAIELSLRLVVSHLPDAVGNGLHAHAMSQPKKEKKTSSDIVAHLIKAPASEIWA